MVGEVLWLNGHFLSDFLDTCHELGAQKHDSGFNYVERKLGPLDWRGLDL